MIKQVHALEQIGPGRSELSALLYFSSDRLHSAIRLLQPNNASFHKYFISADRCVIYADCTVTISPYYAHGTLQNVVNGYLRNGESMPEVISLLIVDPDYFRFFFPDVTNHGIIAPSLRLLRCSIPWSC